MIQEFDRVVLTSSLRANLPLGMRGTVVMVHENGKGYEVEFVKNGQTVAVETVLPTQIRKIVPRAKKLQQVLISR